MNKKEFDRKRETDLRRLKTAAQRMESARCWLAELERKEVSLSFSNDGQINAGGSTQRHPERD